MRRKILYTLSAFFMIVLFHMIYSIWRASQIFYQWVQIENTSSLSLYFKRQDFFLSFSYALAGAFTIYALLKFFDTRRGSVAGVVGGITLTGILYIGGCFLFGCCGSPMLGVYLSLFGSSFLGFAKPLVAILTTMSVVVGYFWIEKKSKKCCEKNKRDCQIILNKF
jgi:hypothetical protein